MTVYLVIIEHVSDDITIQQR